VKLASVEAGICAEVRARRREARRHRGKRRAVVGQVPVASENGPFLVDLAADHEPRRDAIVVYSAQLPERLRTDAWRGGIIERERDQSAGPRMQRKQRGFHIGKPTSRYGATLLALETRAQSMRFHRASCDSSAPLAGGRATGARRGRA